MTRETTEIAIATLIHAYDHPGYDTCGYCVFCLGFAKDLLDRLPPKDAA